MNDFFNPEENEEIKKLVKEAKNDAVAFYRLFSSEDGQRVLDYIERFVSRPVPVEHLPYGAVHKEGQQWLLYNIRSLIERGRRLTHGS